MQQNPRSHRALHLLHMNTSAMLPRIGRSDPQGKGRSSIAVFRLPPRRNIVPCQKAEVLLTETLSHCTVVLIGLQTIHIFRRCLEYIFKIWFIFRQNGRTVPIKVFLHVDLWNHLFTSVCPVLLPSLHTVLNVHHYHSRNSEAEQLETFFFSFFGNSSLSKSFQDGGKKKSASHKPLTYSCRVSTPFSLYCSSCFICANSRFSLES